MTPTAVQRGAGRRGAVRAAAWRLALLAGGLLLAGWLLRQAGGGGAGAAWVDRHVRGHGAAGALVFVLAGTAACAAGVPRQGVAFLGGYAFGAVPGAALALAAQGLGCAVSYGWARAVGRAWAERRLAGRFGARLRPLRDALAGSPFGATLALRLLPVGNNLALNLLAGLSGVAALPFVAGSLLGYLPQTAVFALLGDGVALDQRWRLGLGAGLFALSVALGAWLLRRHRAGRAMGRAMGRAVAGPVD